MSGTLLGVRTTKTDNPDPWAPAAPRGVGEEVKDGSEKDETL